MRAFVLESFDAQPTLGSDLPEPRGGEDELVERVGSNVTRFRAGDEVFGFVRHANPTVHDGSWADLIVLPEDDMVAEKPRGVGFAQAGAAALAGLSAVAAFEALAVAVREAHPAGVDAILDVVSQAPDASLLKDGGRLASTLGAAGEGPGRFDIMADPTPTNLRRVAELLEAGTLRVPIQRSYELEQAGEALQALPGAHTQGKLGLTIAQTRR